MDSTMTRRSFPTVTAGLALALLAGCGPLETGEAAQGEETPAPAASPGRLVIVGGGLKADNEPVYRAVVEGREGEGPICVIPTASGSPESSMASAVERFAALVGPEHVEGILVTSDDPSVADGQETGDQLRRCSAFWFTGGAQSRVVDAFRPGGVATEGYRALMERMAEGAAVAGSSAGAAMMSDPMIGSGASADAFVHGVRGEEDAEGVWITPGMGFFPRALLDQHFLARGRIGRLLVAAVSGDGPSVGFGIDENTALVVDGDRARVEGASGVVVVDARAARSTGSLPASEGIRLHLAGPGDAIDLSTLEVSPSAAKVALPPGAAVETPEDTFARWAFLHFLAAFAVAPDGEAVLHAPGHTLRIRKGDGFRALSSGTVGVEGTPGGLSAGPFLVDIEPAG